MIVQERSRLLVLAVFAVALAFAAEPLLTGRGTDFRAYVEAAGALRAGHDPYAGVYPFLYPPLLAVVLVPLTFVPPAGAAWIWAAASAAALAASARLVAKGSARVLLLALLFAPFAATQWNLQANAFVLLLLVLARDRLDRGFEAGGGAFLGLSIALKPFGLLAAVALVLGGRWRAGLAAAGAALLPFALVMPFTGAVGVAAAAGSVKRILSSSWVDTYGANVSLNGSLDRLLPDGAGAGRHLAVGLVIAGWTVALVAAAAAGALGRGKRLRPAAVVDAALAATLLGASSSWLHHSAILFPAVAALPPAAQTAALALYGVAAAWRGFTSFGTVAGGAASLAGTAALVLVWLLSSRRAAEPC
jgi:hypothetical protein